MTDEERLEELKKLTANINEYLNNPTKAIQWDISTLKQFEHGYEIEKIQLVRKQKLKKIEIPTTEQGNTNEKNTEL